MNWKRAMIGAAIVAPMVGLLAYGMTQDPRDIPSPLPGRGAPGFALRVFASGEGATARQPGDTVRLADLRGEVVVLNFWASWCLACRDEHEALSHVAKRYAGKGVHFVGVLYQDVANAGFKWIEEMGGQSYPSVLDPRARTAIDYGLYGVPETFFIGRDGRVGYKHVGPVTEALLAFKIDSLLAVPAGP